MFCAAGHMRLEELSEGYKEAASLLRAKLRSLRKQKAQEADPECRAMLQHTISSLGAILTQCNELAELTEHYYERGYTRNEKYTL